MLDTPFGTRSSGILLHPTSLPGPFALGDIGPRAREFVDFLAAAGQSWWQMLPIHPVGGGNSPYDSSSAFAGSTLLISLDGLVEDGLLTARDLAELPRQADPRHADFEAARKYRPALLRRAHGNFQRQERSEFATAYQKFVADSGSWLWDWALFRSLKECSPGQNWTAWPERLRTRKPDALASAHEEHREAIGYQAFLQFAFARQWEKLKEHAHSRRVQLMGDIPMFVAHDSVDVWANQDMFFLDPEGQRTVQAGVPPDYFSEDGQLWGNPLYRWPVMQANGYGWWIDRLRRELGRFDAVRLDHFVAFHRYWEVPMNSGTARDGRYVEAPGADFLASARRALGALPLVAEDLGIVTPEVERLRDQFGLPGMRILQFAFSPGAEGYLPHRHPVLSVAYTGTHDNNTTRGWYETLLAHAAQESAQDERRRAMAVQARVELNRVQTYTGVTRAGDAAPALLRTLLSSAANTVIFPIQDALDQAADCRMNVPGVAEGNWAYRVAAGALTPELAARLEQLARVTERI